MNKNIVITKKTPMANPVLLAAWPGMGNVALGCVDYLRQQTQAQFCAEIDIRGYVTPEFVFAEHGLAQLPHPPRNYFYCVENPPLLLFESESHLSGEQGVRLIHDVIDYCREMNVRQILTGAAFALPASHREPSHVYGVATSESLLEQFPLYSIEAMEEGPISGLNGLLVGYAKEAGIEAMCLLATMPVYAVNFPNPKASKALVETFAKLIGITVDLKPIDAAVADMESKLELIEQNLKGVLPEKEGKEAADGTAFDDQGKVPSHVIDKIEKLFHETKLDKSKAVALKEELDRWSLYKMYEDRFLSLFKEKQ